MPLTALFGRVDRLSQARPRPIGQQLIVISPEDWPEEVMAAYDAAAMAGNVERQADIIAQQEGMRPVIRYDGVPTVIELRSYSER